MILQRQYVFTVFLSVCCFVLLSCKPEQPHSETVLPTSITLDLSSPSFQQGQVIPIQLTCSGQDLSPELSWSAPPLETHTLALVMDDPDAPKGIWQHWLVYNIPGNIRSLSSAQPQNESLENSALQGLNDFKHLGYNGPCPPQGQNHRYFFRLYALNTRLDIAAGASRDELEQAMQGHILAQGELMGQFLR